MGQSMFNRWIGSDPFSGSSKSTAMGNSHVLNSIGSANTRFNPANLINENSIFTFDIQLEQTSIFERWSMPIRDSFDDVLANADYVANEFSQFGIRGGLSSSIPLLYLDTLHGIPCYLNDLILKSVPSLSGLATVISNK